RQQHHPRRQRVVACGGYRDRVTGGDLGCGDPALRSDDVIGLVSGTERRGTERSRCGVATGSVRVDSDRRPCLVRCDDPSESIDPADVAADVVWPALLHTDGTAGTVVGGDQRGQVIVQGARYLFGPVEYALVIPPHQPADALVRHPDLGDVTSINGRLRGEINDLDRFFEWLGDEPPRHVPLVTAMLCQIPRVWVWRRLMSCDR